MDNPALGDKGCRLVGRTGKGEEGDGCCDGAEVAS